MYAIAVVFILAATVRYVAMSIFILGDLDSLLGKQLAARAEEVARHLREDVDARLAMLRNLGEKLPPGLLADGEGLAQWLEERQGVNPCFSRGIMALSPDGAVLAAASADTSLSLTASPCQDFLGQCRAGRMAVGPPIPGQDGLALPMGVSLRDASGRVVVVLAGFMGLAKREMPDPMWRGSGQDNIDLVLVSACDGMALAASSPELEREAMPSLMGETPRGHIERVLRSMFGVAADDDVVEARSAVSGLPWLVVARLPLHRAMHPLYNAQHAYVVTTGVGMAVVLVLLYFTLRRVLQPLAHAAEAASRMTRGETPLQPLPMTRQDEAGFLIAAFNALLEKLRRNQAEVARLACHDPLTGLPNRGELANRTEQAKARLQRHGGHMGLLFLDLDWFKQINDTLGHEAGDTVLVEVARRLRTAVRAADTVARIGGDEFVILLEELDADPATARNAALAVAAKCAAALCEPMFVRGKQVVVGASVGVAIGDAMAMLETLLSEADKEMYSRKQQRAACTLALSDA